MFRVEGGVEGDCNQRLWPHAVGRVDQKTATNTCQTVADEVGRQCDHELVAEADSPRLVEELRKILNPDDVGCVRR